MTEWETRIKNRKVVVGVLGLGYVGLPLVKSFTSAGIKVIGFDIDQKKIEILNSGRSIIKHIPHSQVRQMVRTGLFKATANMALKHTV
jgi:UDP-N-acetyl-D-glucosamine dehydrogenase